MLQIKNTLVSLDVIEKKFVCDLSKCMGDCCVHGDYGAPLEPEELATINKYLPKIKDYLNEKAIKSLTKYGTKLKDDEGSFVTPLIDKKECVYTYFESNIAKCAIEKAFLNGDIDFQKPISCHLYPIRITKYPTFIAVNYHKWEICNPASENGKTLGVPVYKFLKDPLIRKFGKKWYDELELTAEVYLSQKSKQ